jgi:glycosyltransferase 2 family protein
MRLLRLGLLLAGAALFIWLVVSIGPGAVVRAFRDLSWRLLVILVFPFGMTTLLDTLGWRYAFRRDTVPFPHLLAARLAGEAFNLTTPTASVGGEAVKAWLVRPWTPLTESLPSVIIAKTTIVIGQALFLVIGIAAAGMALPSDSLVIRGMRWLLVVQLLAVGSFVVVQAAGTLRGSTRWLQRIGWLSDRPLHTLTQINDELAHFYRREPRRLTLSILYHFLAWLIGVLEPWLILRWIGLPVSLAEATAIEAFSTGIRFAAFLVPGYLGALEAGHVAIFAALGLGAPAGLSFTLIRRVRELAWTGLGFLLLMPLRAQAPTPRQTSR